MKKLKTMLAVLLIFSAAVVSAQERKFALYGIGFYNLENLFDTCHDEGKNDYQYLPDGTNKWTGLKYTHKLRNMARVLAELGTDRLPGVGCAAIGVAEVENARCLQDLCNQEPLKARNFQFAHIEGPDQRGVDCALLYNPRLFQVRNVKLVPYVYKLPEDSLRATRGFLTVSGTMAGEHVTIIVNHLPSRFAVSYYREEGGSQLRVVKDSLLHDDPAVKIFVMGDMNDDPQDPSMSKCLGAKRKMEDVGPEDLWNPWWDVLASGTGTLQYQGAWNLFDQIIISPSLLPKPLDPKYKLTSKKFAKLKQKDMVKQYDYSSLTYCGHAIFSRPYLFQQEGKYKFNTLRTHAGGVWMDGYSDHLPTQVYVLKEMK